MGRLARRTMGMAVLAAAVAAAGCGETGTDPSDVAFVEWTSSFGFCPPDAYCTTRLRVEGSAATLTLESRQAPPRISVSQLTAGEADSLARAAAQARFEGLAPVIGCPDCADGGAESLSVALEDEQRSVQFEYNAPVAQLEPLLGTMRALVARLRS